MVAVAAVAVAVAAAAVAAAEGGRSMLCRRVIEQTSVARPLLTRACRPLPAPLCALAGVLVGMGVMAGSLLLFTL